MTTLTIGSGNRADTVRIADIAADQVTVREMIGGGASSWVGGNRAMLGAMRRLAVRALLPEHPAKLWVIVKWSRWSDSVQTYVTYKAFPRYHHRGMAGFGYCVDCGTTGARKICTGPNSW